MDLCNALCTFCALFFKKCKVPNMTDKAYSIDIVAQVVCIDHILWAWAYCMDHLRDMLVMREQLGQQVAVEWYNKSSK